MMPLETLAPLIGLSINSDLFLQFLLNEHLKLITKDLSAVEELHVRHLKRLFIDRSKY